MSNPIPPRPFPGSPSTSKLATSVSHSSPPSHHGLASYGSPSVPSPPAPPIFSLSGETSIEYTTLSLPDECVVRWRSFRPIFPPPSSSLPPPPSAPPSQSTSTLQAQDLSNDREQPTASSSKLVPTPSSSSSSTWDQHGIQTIESARRSLLNIARPRPSTNSDSSTSSSILSSSLLAIATPSPPPSSSDAQHRPLDIQHPSPASLDGSAPGGGPPTDSSGELWIFAISSKQEEEQPEEGQLESQGEHLFDQLKAFKWEGLQESSSGQFSPSSIYPPPPTPSMTPPFDPSKLPASSTSPNISPLKPHPHLVPAYPTFLRAAKESILEEMTAGEHGGIRYGDGILISEPEGSGSDDGGRKGEEWGDCWKVSGFRTVLLLTFTLTVLPNLILLTPRARRIPFFPFPTQPHSTSPPPPLGTNIVLLPLATKAIFVRTSSTSTSESRTAEEKSFWQGLEGRGVRAQDRSRSGEWIVCWVPSSSSSKKSIPSNSQLGAGGEGPMGISNKDKIGGEGGSNEEGGGTLVSWPACLVLVDSASSTPSSSAKQINSRTIPSSATSSSHHIHKPHRNLANQPKPLPSLILGSSRLPSLWSSLTSSSARLSFVSSTSNTQQQSSVSTDLIDDIALASGVYLETLVREREKEKERVEEERERERRKKELDELAAASGTSGIDENSGKPLQPLSPPGDSDDLWGSPSPPAVQQSSNVAVAPPQVTQPDLMDWSWSGQDFDGGGNGGGSTGSFGLGRDRADDTWGEEVDDDDFDFFNTAPLLDNSTSFVLETDLENADSTLNLNNPSDLLSSLTDQNFSLSPLPSHLLPPPPSGGPSNQFSPSLDVDMAFSSPLNLHIFPQSTTPLPQHASPGSANNQVAASPASWAYQGRTPKTPKTPFSPFVEIEEDLLEVDEEWEGDGNEGAAPLSASGTSRSTFAPPGFDAITFGSSHALADEKYERGKFAIPLQSEEEEMDGLEKTRRRGWRAAAGAQTQGSLDASTSNKRRKLEHHVKSLLPPWMSHNKLPAFPPLFPSVHQPPSEGVDQQLRSLYDQLSNPKLGTIQRLKETSAASSKRKRSSSKGELSKLPNEFGRRLRISNSIFQDSDGGPRSDDDKDERDSDRDDREGIDRLGGGRSLPTILGLDVKAESSHHPHAHHQHRPELEPLVGLDLLSSSFFNVFPSLPPSIIPLPHHHFASSNHPTPTPSSAATPAAAATPAWAPTPTSPPSGSVARETTQADIEMLADWLGREVVENPMVGGQLRKEVGRKSTGEGSVLFGDAELIRRSLKSIDNNESTPSRTLSSLASLQGSDLPPSPLTVEPLLPPQISIGHQSAVVKVSPAAIRFWDRIGLEPIGGRKDVLAFALFEASGPSINAKVGSWLGRVGAAYESRGLGKHVVGSATNVVGGLLPFTQAGFSDALGTILTELGTSVPHIVVYLVTPRGLKSSTFSLRDVQAQLTSSSNTPLSSRLVFHTVSLAQVIEEEGSSLSSPSSLASLERTALAMYDRLPVQIDRLIPRKMFPEDDPSSSSSNTSTSFYNNSSVSSSIPHPAYHLARTKTPAMQFTLTWPPPTLNLLDRHSFLHLGYGITGNGEWLCAFVVDERGQKQETKVWRLEVRYSWERVVGRLWAFATGFAKTADVEWRLVVCKMGLMGWGEIGAWDTLLSQRVPHHASPLHVFLTCSKQSSNPPFVMDPPTLPPSSQPSTSDLPSQASKQAFFLDVSQLSLALFPNHRRPYSIPSDDHPVSSLSLPTLPSSSSNSPCSSQEDILALSSFIILNIPHNPTLTSSSSSSNALVSSSAPSLVNFFAAHHLLQFASPTSSKIPATSDFRRELARNFHALDVLGRERNGAGGGEAGGLPLHLRGVEAMMEVVEGVREGCYGL